MFPHTIPNDSAEVCAYIRSLGGTPFVVPPPANDYERKVYPQMGLFEGLVSCNGTSTTGSSKELATWHPTQMPLKNDLWTYYIDNDFAEYLTNSAVTTKDPSYPTFLLMDDMAALLEAYGYPRNITVDTLALYDQCSSVWTKARENSRIKSGETLLHACADMIQSNPDLPLGDRVDAIWLNIPMTELLAHLGNGKTPYSLIRELYAYNILPC